MKGLDLEESIKRIQERLIKIEREIKRIKKSIGIKEPAPEVELDERFLDLKGVGEELAEELTRIYGDFDSFVKEARPSRLIEISGIGKSKARKLLDQIKR